MSVKEAVGKRSVAWLFGKFYPRQLVALIVEHAGEIAPGKEKELAGRIEELVPKLVEADRDLAIDAQSASMLQISALILASYQVLGAESGDDEKTIDFLQRVIKKIGRRSTKLSTWMLMGVPGNRMKTLEKALETGVDAFGETFEYEGERNGDESYELKMTRCFFYNYFSKHGVPRLTSVLCVGDEVWMEEIDPAVDRHRVKAERPTLMSSGDGACRFQFRAVR